MAIEITPRRKIKMPLWTIILGGVCIILLIGLIASYFYFELRIKKISQEIEDKESAAVPLERGIRDKEGELRPLKQKIEDFSGLLSEHKEPLNIFTFLESICLPNIWFSNFNFSSEGDVSVSGKTDNFTTLEYQIFVLKQEPIVKDLNISGVSREEEGTINFSFLLTFNPRIFK